MTEEQAQSTCKESTSSVKNSLCVCVCANVLSAFFLVMCFNRFSLSLTFTTRRLRSFLQQKTETCSRSESKKMQIFVSSSLPWLHWHISEGQPDGSFGSWLPSIAQWGKKTFLCKPALCNPLQRGDGCGQEDEKVEVGFLPRELRPGRTSCLIAAQLISCLMNVERRIC